MAKPGARRGPGENAANDYGQRRDDPGHELHLDAAVDGEGPAAGPDHVLADLARPDGTTDREGRPADDAQPGNGDRLYRCLPVLRRLHAGGGQRIEVEDVTKRWPDH